MWKPPHNSENKFLAKQVSGLTTILGKFITSQTKAAKKVLTVEEKVAEKSQLAITMANLGDCPRNIQLCR